MDWKNFSSRLGRISPREKRRVEKAYALAKHAHSGQFRKSGEPYFVHPTMVAEMLANQGADTDTIIAALLHDTIEDTPLTLEEIDREFGPTVTSLVNGVTKLNSSSFRQGPKLNEQVETLRKIFTLMKEDVRIIVIKLFDRLHNMQTVGYLLPERQLAFAEETREIFVKIAEKLGMLDVRDQLALLCLETIEADTCSKLIELQTANRLRGAEIIDVMHRELLPKFDEWGERPELSYEDKNIEQLRIQLRMEGSTATGYPAVIVAFVCDGIDDCYRTLGSLHQIWKREILSFQDFINSPGFNGYRGLHTTVILDDGTRVRCKIRTREMHDYARKGVMTMCFQGITDITDILLWAQRISPLAQDTEESSEDFWQSLQSDILGESFTVYGPGGSSAQIPKQSTALDAAFYLLREEALKVTSIKIDGTAVPFDAPLKQAVSLDMTLSEDQATERGWLSIVRTGFATAVIRSALAAHPDRSKISVGQHALQRVLSAHKKGMLDELNPASLSALLGAQGFGSLDDAYIAIAEGRRKAEEVYDALFEKRTNGTGLNQRTTYRFRFSIAENSIPTLKQLIGIGHPCDIDWPSIRVKRSDSQMHVSGNVMATSQELQILKQDLRWAGATDLETMTPAVRREHLLTAIVILLWGLNPVVAKWLLLGGITPMTLVSIRMITFGLCASIVFVGWAALTRKRFTFIPIPHLIRLAVLPSLITVALAIFTYDALLSMPPSLHLTIIRFNVLLLPAAHFLHRIKAWMITAMGIIMTVASIGILTLAHPATIGWGTLLSLLALCAYVLYSLIVERTLSAHKIGFRYPALLFSSGLLLGLFGLALFPISNWRALTAGAVGLSALYASVCVFVPHAFFYMLLNKRQTKTASDLFFLEPPIAILGEMILLGIFLQSWMYGIIATTLAVIYLMRKRQNGKNVE